MPALVANCAKKVAPPSRGPCTRVRKAICAVSDKPKILADFSTARIFYTHNHKVALSKNMQEVNGRFVATELVENVTNMTE